MTIRETAVAGLFYAAGAEELQRNINTLLCSADSSSRRVPKALIVPHAGYIYSGPVAAAAFRLLEPAVAVIRRVLLFGPAHRVYLRGMAVPAVESFATPLGSVPLDRMMIDEMTTLPGVCVSDAAHSDEHSLEVQLPFLQSVLDDFSLVPVVVGKCDPQLVATVMDTLWGGPETLIVVSSDLSHYLPYNLARQADERTSERILAKSTDLSGGDACGAHAINGLLSTKHCQPLTVEAIDLRNSGDTAGDKDRVVGYGAFILH